MVSERQSKSRSLLQKRVVSWRSLSYFLLISEALFAEATLAVMRLVSAGFGCLEKSTNGTHFKFFIKWKQTYLTLPWWVFLGLWLANKHCGECTLFIDCFLWGKQYSSLWLWRSGIGTCYKEENNCPMMASYADFKRWGVSKSLGGNEDSVLRKTVLNDLKICNMTMDCLITY